jgi:hypothetical protein
MLVACPGAESFLAAEDVAKPVAAVATEAVTVQVPPGNETGGVVGPEKIIARSAQPLLDPMFSPDGKKLVWLEGAEGARRLFLGDIENPAPKRLTE